MKYVFFCQNGGTAAYGALWASYAKRQRQRETGPAEVTGLAPQGEARAVCLGSSGREGSWGQRRAGRRAAPSMYRRPQPSEGKAGVAHAVWGRSQPRFWRFLWWQRGRVHQRPSGCSCRRLFTWTWMTMRSRAWRSTARSMKPSILEDADHQEDLLQLKLWQVSIWRELRRWRFQQWRKSIFVVCVMSQVVQLHYMPVVKNKRLCLWIRLCLITVTGFSYVCCFIRFHMLRAVLYLCMNERKIIVSCYSIDRHI